MTEHSRNQDTRSGVALTFDVDWASDDVITAVAEELREAQIPSTWFVTHSSPAIDQLRDDVLFELGVHPNFFLGSSHGESEGDVMNSVLEIVPEAISVRTHGLSWSSRILAILLQSGLKVDASVFLPMLAHVRPIRQCLDGQWIVRVPYIWSDDHELGLFEPRWDTSDALALPGLKVLNFHPIHVFLNSSEPSDYRGVKELGPLASLRSDELEPFVHEGPGVRTAFRKTIHALRAARVLRVGELAQK